MGRPGRRKREERRWKMEAKEKKEDCSTAALGCDPARLKIRKK